jgi:hypothetical protein
VSRMESESLLGEMLLNKETEAKSRSLCGAQSVSAPKLTGEQRRQSKVL